MAKEKGLGHLCKPNRPPTDDAAKGHGSDGLGEGDHLQGRGAPGRQVVQRNVRLRLRVVNGHVEDDRERHEDEPPHEGPMFTNSATRSFMNQPMANMEGVKANPM
ncbi:MAG: hypothetical protein CM15mP18_2900 [Methanobacteriota archaeon]|nr:MAG: hypothetical protein CM15mP18_2900 [Euryarchaeota archaeon]